MKVIEERTFLSQLAKKFQNNRGFLSEPYDLLFYDLAGKLRNDVTNTEQRCVWRRIRSL